MLHRVQERVRELELELAQTKLAHVEAECRNQVTKIYMYIHILCNTLLFRNRKIQKLSIYTNCFLRQDLTHQLHATASELQAARNSWPWFSKTLSSIKEAANKREVLAPGALRDLRRDSAPGGDLHHLIHSRNRDARDSLKEVV